MPVTFDRAAQPAVIRLAGKIDIAVASELKDLLLAALGLASEVHISLEQASSLDVTAVQLLWAAERQARASGGAVLLEGAVPEGLSVALKEAGFEPLACAARLADVDEAHA